MNTLQTALEAIEILSTDNTSEQAQAAAADARIKLANEMAVEPVAHFNMAINETVGCIAYEYGKHNLKSGTPLYLHSAPQQADDLSLAYAKSLAVSTAKKHYPEATEFELLGDMHGVIGQIDHMLTGMQRKPQQAKPKTAGDVQEMCIAALQRAERAELIQWLRERSVCDGMLQLSEAADMLEADANLTEQLDKRRDQIGDLKVAHAKELRELWAKKKLAQPQATTGWDNGLSQDYCKELGQWLASRPGARQQVKEMFEADAQQAKQVPMTVGEIYTAYVTAANQTLRPQDERIALAFARELEAHHHIGGEV